MKRITPSLNIYHPWRPHDDCTNNDLNPAQHFTDEKNDETFAKDRLRILCLTLSEFKHINQLLYSH